ncbi:endonuclease/exonuclease/phosphatase family protein [Deminuibacter soli]|uniref:Endonuclease/exonuclease/phosphatase domain-containing protein n=1 Tax=Deminuibacter soli TaxID=2291815 RepID=A0A3E1NQY3_9BACT|nr:endonuclease/exonuclease/phosphatase family protein [Deminuibacter soli]RFM30224.1 hypothetical protein DXN05_04435 [Deminuibacter soli]
MKKFFVWLFRLLCWIVMAGYLVAACSSYCKPSVYFFSEALALAYPIALILLFVVIVINVFVNRKLALLATVILFLGFGNLQRSFAFHPLAKVQRTHTDSSALRILTWNVYFFQNDHWLKHDTPNLPRRQMVEAIRKFNPDVLCFQEYLSYSNTNWNVNMNETFAEMGYKYQFFSNDKKFTVANGYSQLGTMILSKLPFIDTLRLPLHNTNTEHLEAVDVAFQQKPVRIFATHLASLGLYTDTEHTGLGSENIYELTYSRKRTVLRKLKTTGVEHEKESAIISRAINTSPNPAVFCADMNAGPCAYAYRVIRGNMQDAYIRRGFGFGQTYDALSPTLRIDVCLVDKRLEVTNCFVEKLHGLSDHFPVITDVQWKNNK